jgi:hypothetical protein
MVGLWNPSSLVTPAPLAKRRANLNASSQGGKTMKPFTTATLVILALVAVLHALRVGLGWSVTVDGTDIPMWASVVAVVIAAGLAIGLWRETHV